MVINARIDVDSYQYDKKDYIVRMLFSVVEEMEMNQAQAKGRRPSGVFLRVKRGLRNSTIVSKQQQFNTISERHIGWTPMHNNNANENALSRGNFSSWAGANRLMSPLDLEMQADKIDFEHSFEANSDISSGSQSKSVNLSQGQNYARASMRQVILMKSKSRDYGVESHLSRSSPY